jgi:branched-chain amino acid transport system ATP-binding protein
VLLSVDRVAVRFGGITALAGVSFGVADGEICGVIGPNGAGKTTLFDAISGLTRIDGGAIMFDGVRLDALPAHRIAGLGLARTFQNVGLYAGMSVLENVLLGSRWGGMGAALGAALHLPRIAQREAASRDAARALLDDLELGAVADHEATQLPYGTMKRVEIARALMSRPRLLLLDEPAGGLAPGEVEAFAALLRRLRAAHGLTILLVEHHMKLVTSLCDHVVVLHLGATLADGAPDQVRRDAAVVEAYLGAAA